MSKPLVAEHPGDFKFSPMVSRGEWYPNKAAHIGMGFARREGA